MDRLAYQGRHLGDEAYDFLWIKLLQHRPSSGFGENKKEVNSSKLKVFRWEKAEKLASIQMKGENEMKK